MKADARAWHETVNRWLKQFGILSQRFRHQLEKHGIVFMAIANITQLAIMIDQPLFEVKCNDVYE